MQKVKIGDKVKVHYTGTLNSGELFDTSIEREPIEFTVGKGEMIPGFDAAIEGMELKERKSISIKSEDAYGVSKDEMIQVLDAKMFPEDLKLEEGMALMAAGPDGQEHRVVVKEFTAEEVTIDANHPLAGQDLNFDIELVEIV